MRLTLLLAASLSGLASAADCKSYQRYPINADHISKAASRVAINTEGWSWPLEVKARQSYDLTEGSVLFCINNNYYFDNTHVDQGDVIYAVNNIHDQCGSAGGWYEVKGDSGLGVEIAIYGAGEETSCRE